VSLLATGAVVGDEDRYVIEAEIGRGGMQEVYRAIDDKLQRTVALKVPQDARVARRFRESAVISAKVNHPNVAKTLDYFEDAATRFYLVEELVDGPNLRGITTRFDRFDPHAVAHVLHHLARGVAASHRVGVVHRDLKPSNILVEGGLAFRAVKITDFGIAKMAGEEIGNAVAGGDETTQSSRTARGALPYMAPEIIDQPRVPSPPADVWAIAAIAWELLTGKAPFGSGLRAVQAILSGVKPALASAITDHRQFGPLSQTVGDLMLQCFEQNPANRPSAQELAALCDDVCYLPLVRDVGVVENYVARSFGFIRRDGTPGVFFHANNVLGAPPAVGTAVWYSKFDGKPKPRAIPVVPMKPEANEGDEPVVV
jgi:eukaryotic-like serine/threonine-protein kinase